MESFYLIIEHNSVRYTANLHYYPPLCIGGLRDKPSYVCYFTDIEVGAEGHSIEELMENLFYRWEQYNECG